MKAVLHEKLLERHEIIYEGQTLIEVTGESVVSDKMPDIGLLGDTNAHVLLRSKRTEAGAGVMEGDLSVDVSYIPDGASGFCVLKLQLPWLAEFQSDSIDGSNASVGSVRLIHLETRMLNPRKILVKAKLQGNLRVFSSKKDLLYDDIEEKNVIQVRREEVSCSVISTVCEKTFAATDEYPLPAGISAVEVIGKSVQFRIDDIKTLTNKLIVKGCVLSDVVVASREGEAERVSFTSAFSFIAETNKERVSDVVRMDIMPTAMYYEPSADGRALSVEVHGVCQITAYEERNLPYLSDAYSNFYSCNSEYGVLNLYRETKKEAHRENLSGSIVCRSQLGCVRFLTSSCIYDGGQITVTVSACIAYENGTTDWVRKQIDLPLHLREGEKLCEVRLNDLYGGCSGTALEFRLNVEWDTFIEEPFSVKPLLETEWDEDSPLTSGEHSLWIVRGNGALWDIAKKYGSTVMLIQTYNGIEEDEVAGETLLLIPRQRK